MRKGGGEVGVRRRRRREREEEEERRRMREREEEEEEEEIDRGSVNEVTTRGDVWRMERRTNR
eukprot:762428-Hanusia_phi.AAC.3